MPCKSLRPSKLCAFFLHSVWRAVYVSPENVERICEANGRKGDVLLAVSQKPSTLAVGFDVYQNRKDGMQTERGFQEGIERRKKKEFAV